MTIPLLDLTRLHQGIRAELDAVFDRVVTASSFVGGDEVSAFESAFTAAHSSTASAGCGSGTDALTLALVALGVGPGDEVVVPALTFIATAEAVVHAGATPVLADVDPVTLLLSAETVAEVTTTRTRAVMPVHLYGHAVPFDVIAGWKAQGLLVVEDAAQAHLATWQGRPVGSTGDAACFSFYPGKNLGALGDGGLVMSSQEDVIARVRELRDHGRSDKYLHHRIGWCTRLDGLQAGFLNVKLAHLAEWTAQRQALAARYADLLGSQLVPWEDGAVHHLMVMRVPAAARSEVQAALAAREVQTGIHYPVALSMQPALVQAKRECLAAELACSEVVSLPMDPLMTLDEVDVVCQAVVDVLGATGSA